MNTGSTDNSKQLKNPEISQENQSGNSIEMDPRRKDWEREHWSGWKGVGEEVM